MWRSVDTRVLVGVGKCHGVTSYVEHYGMATVDPRGGSTGSGQLCN